MRAGLALLLLTLFVPLAQPAGILVPEVAAVGFVRDGSGCESPYRFVFDASTQTGLGSREASCEYVFAEDVFTGGDCLEWCAGYCLEHANTTVECWRFGPDDSLDQPYARLELDGSFFARDYEGNILTGNLVRSP